MNATTTVRVGVIGAGSIGQQHIRTLSRAVPGARVVGVCDADPGRAEAAARELADVRVFASGRELVQAPEVDAVLVASWGHTHEEFVLAAIEARKPVFCEKPLTPTAAGCQRIMQAEVATRQRLVTVGFMRRFDPAYRELKAALGDGRLGAPLLVHCAHRNQGVPPHYGGDMSITDTAIHEIDSARWLLDDEIVATRVLRPRKSLRATANLQDPLLVLLEMSSGALVDVEVFVTLPFAYEIRCEVVCELGTAALGAQTRLTLRKDEMRSDHMTTDFLERFGAAYEGELRAWVDGLADAGATGPSSWDGYAAAAVADSCVAAL
ncbi:MAG: Gfo/Idh/MocA family oxidoreductase, partial [Chloroflexi bacterium]|nr:Gfo/Idh/MocA family oxidoreductase [Chloroflexota bacterium]